MLMLQVLTPELCSPWVASVNLRHVHNISIVAAVRQLHIGTAHVQSSVQSKECCCSPEALNSNPQLLGNPHDKTGQWM